MRNRSTYISSFPLPLTSLSLGRLITQLKTPADNFFDASTLPSAPTPQSDSTAILNLSEILDKTKGSGVEVVLSSFASLFLKSGKKDAKQLSAYRCTEYYMLNSESWFESICHEEPVRAWLELQAMRGKHVFLVTGYRTFTEATIAQQKASDLKAGATAQLPALAAGGGAVSTFLDPGFKLSDEHQQSHGLGYEVPDEKAFGILYKEVKIKKSAKTETHQIEPILSQTIMWEEIFGLRAAALKDEDPESAIMVEVSLSEAEELPSEYSQIDLENERLAFET